METWYIILAAIIFVGGFIVGNGLGKRGGGAAGHGPVGDIDALGRSIADMGRGLAEQRTAIEGIAKRIDAVVGQVGDRIEGTGSAAGTVLDAIRTAKKGQDADDNI